MADRVKAHLCFSHSSLQFYLPLLTQLTVGFFIAPTLLCTARNHPVASSINLLRKTSSVSWRVLTDVLNDCSAFVFMIKQSKFNHIQTARHWRWRRHNTPKHWDILARLQSIIFRKNCVCSDSAVRTWNFANYCLNCLYSESITKQVCAIIKWSVRINVCVEFKNTTSLCLIGWREEETELNVF